MRSRRSWTACWRRRPTASAGAGTGSTWPTTPTPPARRPTSPCPQAYRYRNYVIDAFNADKPYDQFVREQIAGDLLARGPPDKAAERLIATGFLAVARRFGFDPQNYHHLTIEDTIDTLGKSVLGLTLACARCHDHKFDPDLPGATITPCTASSTARATPSPAPRRHKAPSDFPEAAGRPSPVYAVDEGKPHNARIHKRGEPKTPGDEVPRRFLESSAARQFPPTARAAAGCSWPTG